MLRLPMLYEEELCDINKSRLFRLLPMLIAFRQETRRASWRLLYTVCGYMTEVEYRKKVVVL